MSAGHEHKRANTKTPGELKKLLDEPTAVEMLKRKININFDHEISDTAGYNVVGDTRYIDSLFAQLVRSGKVTVPGMTPEQILHAIFIHELIEKLLLDSDNKIDWYEDAHEMATIAEHEYVRSLGVSPTKYENGIAKIIEHNEKKPVVNPPLDLACAPYLDDPDAEDKRALDAFRKLGIPDAFKKSKESVKYGKSTSDDVCSRCESWEQDRSLDLSTCSKICGLVRTDRWCEFFSEMKDGEELDRASSQEQGGPSSLPGSSRGQENPSGEDQQGNALVQPQGPQASQFGQNPQGNALNG